MGRPARGIALRARRAALAVAALLACAGLDATAQRTERLRALAAGRAAPDAPLVLVEAASSQAAWGRVVRARTEAPLEESELLARLLDAGAEPAGEIVVGGPWAPLNEQVLRDAFALARRRDLAGVRLVLVGPEASALAARCGERGALCEPVTWNPPGDSD